MRLTWSPSFSIGHEEIDRQHIKLFGYFDEFLTASSQGAAKQALVELHSRLDAYTKAHFRDEEKLMRDSGYPELDQHRRQHQGFQKRMAELRQEILEQGPTLMVLVQTNKTLVDWLIHHVQTQDQKVGEFLQGRVDRRKSSTG